MRVSQGTCSSFAPFLASQSILHVALSNRTIVQIDAKNTCRIAMKMSSIRSVTLQQVWTWRIVKRKCGGDCVGHGCFAYVRSSSYDGLLPGRYVTLVLQKPCMRHFGPKKPVRDCIQVPVIIGLWSWIWVCDRPHNVVMLLRHSK